MPGPSLVVLAGGESSRFGTDKLSARVGEHDLLSFTLSLLPPGRPVIVVGPARPVHTGHPDQRDGPPTRSVTWVRESPPRSGPARAVHAGVAAALALAPDRPVVVLPGDAPEAHLAVEPLLAALAGLADEPAGVAGVDGVAGVAGVVGQDADGGPQPLHLALTPSGAARLVAHPPGPGASARSLARALGLVPVTLPAAAVADVDHPDDLARWLAARRHG